MEDGNISCECETSGNKPVDFLGDVTCGSSHAASKVRDMIQKFDIPNKHCDLRPKAGAECSGNSLKKDNMSHTGGVASSSKGSFGCDFAFQEDDPAMASLVNNPQSQPNLPSMKSFLCLSREDKLSNSQKFSFMDKQRSSSIDFQQKPSQIHSSYRSKTTIAKTTNGVRIITDIHFDPNGPSIEENIGSHIETDIPPSRILADFQRKNKGIVANGNHDGI